MYTLHSKKVHLKNGHKNRACELRHAYHVSGPHTLSHSRSTELGIIRATEAIQQGTQYVAILDLKETYDTVPRDKIIKVIEKSLPGNLAKMIVYMLQPNIFETVGDRGVPQDSPLSPALYNVFMDTSGERIVRTSLEDGRPGSLFAEDVILMSATHSGATGAARHSNHVGP